MRINILAVCFTVLTTITTVNCELKNYRSTLGQSQNEMLDQMLENFGRQNYEESVNVSTTEIRPLASRVTYNYCVGGFILALNAYQGSVNSQVEKIIDTCNWNNEQANGRDCARHVIEASGAIGLTWLAGASINGRTIVSRIYGHVSQMNELTGNQEIGNLAKRDSCPRDLVNTADDIGVTFSNPNYGVITTCESSCQISQVSSIVSEVLGKMANDVVNQNLNDIQYTIALPNKKAVARCNIYISTRPQPPCPRTVTGKGCQTKLRGC